MPTKPPYYKHLEQNTILLDVLTTNFYISTKESCDKSLHTIMTSFSLVSHHDSNNASVQLASKFNTIFAQCSRFYSRCV
jgi:hypothetical protein